ncbi:MAG: potassium channel family protein [Gaiellaceae bacterium]
MPNPRPQLAAAGARARAQRELRLFLRRLAQLGVLICLLFLTGTVGLAVSEDVSLWFAFIWTIDTIATLGAIAPPETTAGQVLKLFMIFLGVGTLLYGLVAVTEFFVAGHATGLLDARRRQKMIDTLDDHYLICGFGRVGRQVAQDLRAAGARYAVIDPSPESLRPAEEAGIPCVEAEASDEAALREAGIDRARALIACVDSDAENVFITLTARELRPDLTIVARAGREESERKLRRAGADRVVSPYKSSGSDMARLALHPQVADVVAVTSEYRLEEIEVTGGCPGAGQALADVRGSAIIAALRDHSGNVIPQPPGDIVLEPGHVLIAIGTAIAMDRLEAAFAPPASR